MKNMGLDQWQKGYPNEYSIREDVDKGISYVMEENGRQFLHLRRKKYMKI